MIPAEATSHGGEPPHDERHKSNECELARPAGSPIEEVDQVRGEGDQNAYLHDVYEVRRQQAAGDQAGHAPNDQLHDPPGQAPPFQCGQVSAEAARSFVPALVVPPAGSA